MRERIAAVREELALEKLRHAASRTPHTESEGERFLQDTRGSPYYVDKAYHEELDRNGDQNGFQGSALDLDYCTPSFANHYFAPTFASGNLVLNHSGMASSEEFNIAWSRDADNALDGNLCTKWSSSSGAFEWFVVDLGFAHELHNVSVFWDANSYATDYVVETSLDHTFEQTAWHKNEKERRKELESTVFQTVAAPFSDVPAHASAARTRFRRRFDEKYVQDLLLLAGLPWRHARFLRIAAVRSSTLSPAETRGKNAGRSGATGFGIREIGAWGRRIGQVETARTLISAAERARVSAERDKLAAMHQALARQYKQETRERVSELANKAEDALDLLRRQSEQRGEQAGADGVTDDNATHEAELQSLLDELAQEIAMGPDVSGQETFNGGVAPVQKQRSRQDWEEEQRRMTLSQPQLWRQRAFVPAANHVPPRFVAAWIHNFRGHREYWSLFRDHKPDVCEIGGSCEWRVMDTGGEVRNCREGAVTLQSLRPHVTNMSAGGSGGLVSVDNGEEVEEYRGQPSEPETENISEASATVGGERVAASVRSSTESREAAEPDHISTVEGGGGVMPTRCGLDSLRLFAGPAAR